MREWLSGIASPCQGEGRGFDPRLALEIRKGDIRMDITFSYFEPNPGLEGFGLRSATVGAKLRSTGPHAPPSREKKAMHFTS